MNISHSYKNIFKSFLIDVLWVSFLVFTIDLLPNWFAGVGGGQIKKADISFYLSLIVCILSIGLLLRNNRCLRSLFSILVSCISFIFVVSWLHLERPIDSAVIFLLMQTNISEAKNYLIANLSPLYLLPLILIYLWCHLRKKYKLSFPSFRSPIVTVAAFFFFAISFTYCISKGDGIRLWKLYSENKSYFDSIQARRDIDISKLMAISTTAEPQFHVVIIGESDSRDHWSIYGYSRHTTPMIEKLIDETEYNVVLKRAFSSDKYTEFALAYALTEKNQYVEKDFRVSFSLLDVLNVAGFETYWISNQGRTNNMGSSFATIADSAQHTFYVNDREFSFADDRPTDIGILSFLDKIKFNRQKNTVVIIHLMGSHGPYHIRYPTEEQFFQVVSVIDHYDNSIRYTDKIIYEIYKYFEHYHPDSFIYFADHGEEPGIGRDHFYAQMFRIPLFGIFKKPTKSFLGFLKNASLDKPFTNDLIYDTLIGLYQIQTNHYKQDLDFSSDGYAINDSVLKVNSGKNTLRDVE